MSQLTVNQAWQIAGGLSQPSKMPCHGYSIPASRCKVGSKLRSVAGSVCNKCYALKGRYIFPNVQGALERRFASLEDLKWVSAMVTLLTHLEHSGYFRWHDSGDLQSVQHLEKITEVCKGTPHINHWLPTREYAVVRQYIAKHGKLPSNLTIRLSAFMVNEAFQKTLAKAIGCPTSNVSSDGHFTCPSSSQHGKCDACRACWDKKVKNVTYKAH